MPIFNAGMYQNPTGEIFKVQISKTSGQPYAKKLQPIGGARLVDATGEAVNFEFVYTPGAIRSLTPEMAMTLEAAQAFGLRFGVCCVCGAFLKDAKSVANGIGPVCAKRGIIARGAIVALPVEATS
jgi:hypothetical protein